MPSAGSVAIQLCVTGSITTGSASWTSISVCTRLCSAHILHYHNCVVGTWLVLEICAREVVVALEQNIFPHCSMRRISAGTCKLLAPKAWHDAEGSDIFQQLVFFGLSVQLLGAVFKFLDCEIISASEFREGFPELVCRPSLLLCPSNSLRIKLTGPAVLSNSWARVWSLDQFRLGQDHICNKNIEFTDPPEWLHGNLSFKRQPNLLQVCDDWTAS